MLQERIILLDKQIERLDETAEDVLLDQGPVQRLLRIPGFGKLEACTVFLETGDPSRFSSARHFVSYCGLTPGRPRPHPQRRSARSRARGNPFLKRAFWQASNGAITGEGAVTAWIEAHHRNKPGVLVTTIVAKELARVAFRILHDDVDYNGTFKGNPLVGLEAE